MFVTEHSLFDNGQHFLDKANADVAVFRVSPDKKYAERLTVRFGAIESELIEIKSGLREGDNVIVTDMGRFAGAERIRIE